MVEVVVDGRFEFGHRGEDTAPDAVMSDQAEEALDLVEPRCRGRGEVQVKARVLVEPCRRLGMLVGGMLVGGMLVGGMLVGGMLVGGMLVGGIVVEHEVEI